MTNKNLNNFLINKDRSIKEAMRIIDRNGSGIALVIDKKKKLFGIVTDGDIRGAILKGININKKVEEITNRNPITIKNKGSLTHEIGKKVREKIATGGSLKIPVVNKKGVIEDIIFVYIDKGRVFQTAENKLKTDKGGVKSVLVTGGAGYLGSILCRKLLNRGYRVRVLDNLTYGDEGVRDLYKNKNFELLKGDVRNISEVVGALRGADAVIHLAAIVGDPAGQLDPKRTIEINYLSTNAIANACKYNQINKFLFTSTCSVYGVSETPDDRLREDSSLNPVSLYAETKLKSEEGIFSLADENFSPTIFRFGTLYGISPRMRFDLVINTLTARALVKKQFSIFGGQQWRPNLEVSDAAEACLLWLNSPIKKVEGEVFNVGANEQNCKIIEIGQTIKKIIPEAKMEIEKEKGDQRNYNVSFDKISRVLGFKAKKTIKDGIREMIKFKDIKNFDKPKYSN